ncbi:MAG: hypothetical protein LQ346_008835 [Caloplaca aetnensis]|nr:MAG: hypothetical protein LQ346_008835 [Caloplaca aetnensis]
MCADETQTSNHALFRDCLSGPIVHRSAVGQAKSARKRKPKGRKTSIKLVKDEAGVEDPGERDAEELADFVDYLAAEIFDSFPKDLQSVSYSAVQNDARLAKKSGDPLSPAALEQALTAIPPPVAESLETYGLLEEQSDLPKFLTPVLQEYVNAATSPPPLWSSTRTSACEICERDWIPLSYHHLIPKQIHAKAIKRGWHEEWRLNSVAWLCRACHSFVHRVASNEELAKDYWTVERLMGREDVVAWAKWVGRVRWKAR